MLFSECYGRRMCVRVRGLDPRSVPLVDLDAGHPQRLRVRTCSCLTPRINVTWGHAPVPTRDDPSLLFPRRINAIATNMRLSVKFTCCRGIRAIVSYTACCTVHGRTPRKKKKNPKAKYSSPVKPSNSRSLSLRVCGSQCFVT